MRGSSRLVGRWNKKRRLAQGVACFAKEEARTVQLFGESNGMEDQVERRERQNED